MLLEMIMFALIFVTVQMVGTLLVMKYFMSEKFIKKYSRMVLNISKEFMEEMEDEFM